MKIALLGPSYKPLTTAGKDGGIERVVEQLATHLADSGHSVTLFGPGDSDEALRHHPRIQFRETTPQSLFLRYPHPEQKSLRDKKMDHVVASVVHELRELNADVIHSHESLVVGAGGAEMKNMLSTTHNCLLPGHAPDREIFTRHKSHALVTVSRSQQADLRREYFGVVHNGIPVHDFTFHPKPKTGRSAYIAWIGRMRSIKGAAFAIRVAAKLGIKLLMAGYIEPDHAQYYKKMVQPLITKHRGLIEYIGQVNHAEKNDLLGNALLTICPYGCEKDGGGTWNEPFGLVYTESLACGTPVLACHKASAPEIIRHGKTGFLVSPHENEETFVQDFARGALSIIHSRSMREDARRDAEYRWNTSRMASEYETLYRCFLAEKDITLFGEAKELS